MKKYILLSLVALGLLTSSVSGGDYCSAVPLSEVIGASNTLNDSTDLSQSLLLNSQNMLALSESLLAAGSTANTEYVKAMLQLSTDIGTMADRIGEMADRILLMADNIGTMADRILETQRIQGENVALTQKNILQAQANFNSLLNK
jgi:hypothetical protein